MNKIWTDESWEDYLYWQSQDKKTLKRINALLLDIYRNGHEGIGKPEPLNMNSRDFGVAALMTLIVSSTGSETGRLK